ncbi:MAG: hypothetical protein HC902_05730 [Calothrix sp. SM1_5_4]|nr:hypothetical protein [Calothrix sp. SM1_5_4]
MIAKIVALFILLAASGAVFGAPVQVREINAQDEAYLRKALPALFNPQPELSVMDEAIRVLMAKGTYENVFVERADAGYRLIGKSVRVVEAIEFRGPGQIDESELRDLTEIKIGERFDRKKAVAAAERIKNYYGEHGFFNAIVELGFEKTENKNMKLVFDIQEKAACRITGLSFETPNSDLKRKLDREFRRFSGRTLTTDRARRLMNGLNEFLIQERYLTAEVIGPEVEYNDSRTDALLKFEIREPFRFEFYFKGNRFNTITDIYRALDLRNKERKNVDPASEGAERLRRDYLSKGFSNIQIETRVDNPKDTFLKRVHYSINEGPRVKIRQIEVQGRISRPSSYYQDFILRNSSPLIGRGYFNRVDIENGFKT